MKVLKFGGTSVGTVESLRHVKAIVESQQSRCIVIVSALGGITDRLIRTANLAASRDHAYTTEFEIVTARHHEVIEGVVPAESRAEVLAITDAMLDELATLYKAICLLGELTPRTLDMIVSYGERMSCVIVSRILGVPVLDSRSFIRTQSRFGKHVLDAETTSSLLRAAFGPLEQANTVVVPGFIASDSNAQVTNLGRGGSDYTAAIIAAELGAEILEIWTDVDGFMTADPRIVADARVIDRLSFVEAMELCNFGAKVVYPPTIYPVFHRNIPIVIKNTFNASAPGTMIAERVNQTEMTVKGVTSLADTALIRVVGRTFHDFGRVVNSMARNGVDMFLASPTAGTFGVRQNDSVKAVSVLREELAAELTSGDVDAIEAVDSLATLAIVGRNLRSMPESAEMLRRALNQEGIPVLTAPRNDSDTTVACMVPASHVKQALNAVHSSFSVKTMHPYLVNHSEPRPERIRPIPDAFYRNAADMTFREMAYVILDVILGDEIRPDRLKKLIDSSLPDHHPFSPESEANFVAAICAEFHRDEKLMICAAEPEDVYLFEALRQRHIIVDMLVPRMASLPPRPEFIEVQGSAADCLRLGQELTGRFNICSLHNTAARAVRTAVIIYRALHEQGDGPVKVSTGSLVRAADTAKALGARLPHVEFHEESPSCPAIAAAPSFSSRQLRRVAPTASAVVRLMQQKPSVINMNSKKSNHI